MPTYEYACVDCGQHIEVVQSMSDPPLTICATCGGRLRKVFAPIGIVFKGSGFYRTDSRGKSASKESPAPKEPSTTKSSSDSASSSSPDSGGASKSDSRSKSKPASKPAEKSA
jgi:putative FmdB family regulatory protein